MMFAEYTNFIKLRSQKRHFICDEISKHRAPESCERVPLCRCCRCCCCCCSRRSRYNCYKWGFYAVYFVQYSFSRHRITCTSPAYSFVIHSLCVCHACACVWVYTNVRTYHARNWHCYYCCCYLLSQKIFPFGQLKALKCNTLTLEQKTKMKKMKKKTATTTTTNNVNDK